MLDNCFNYIKFIANILLALCRCFHIVPMLGYCYLIKLLKKIEIKNLPGEENNVESKKIISMSGGGFRCIYHLGVYNGICNTNVTGADPNRNINCIGSSMGATTAVVMTSNIDIYKNFVPLICDMCHDYRHNIVKHFTCAGERMKSILETSLPDNIHELISGRCFITVVFLTTHGFEKEIISEFYSKKDVINCITASSFIPIWTSKTLFKYRNKYCIDSCILFDDPIQRNKNTISVTFDKNGDIFPSYTDYNKVSIFIPPHKDKVHNVITCGIEDGTNYIMNN